MTFQTPNLKKRPLDRTDHIWIKKGGRWKCVLCGALSCFPPNYPTDPAYVPGEYENLTQQERDLVPFKLSGG